VESDPEAAYYQTVEEFFVSRRGDPLFLSNADWLLVRKWRRQEIPLRVVLRGVSDALDGHAHSFNRHQKVGSLAYCAPEVERAQERWRHALDLGRQESGVDVALGLRRLAEALAGATGLGPASRDIAERLRREIGAERVAQRFSEAEPWLAAAEAELVAALEAEDDSSTSAEIDAEIDRVLSPYAGRMPARVLAQIRAESRVRRRLERHGLPRLSLFHAEEGGPPLRSAGER
jgi:hypothetical protein